MPKVDSVVNIWNSANWYEREAFDLFGILFDGHPDLAVVFSLIMVLLDIHSKDFSYQRLYGNAL
ncbi:MAG: NADH-quinone oxidoreductase subunit C [Thiotrichaceae bacterium]